MRCSVVCLAGTEALSTNTSRNDGLLLVAKGSAWIDVGWALGGVSKVAGARLAATEGDSHAFLADHECVQACVITPRRGTIAGNCNQRHTPMPSEGMTSPKIAQRCERKIIKKHHRPPRDFHLKVRNYPAQTIISMYQTPKTKL